MRTGPSHNVRLGGAAPGQCDGVRAVGAHSRALPVSQSLGLVARAARFVARLASIAHSATRRIVVLLRGRERIPRFAVVAYSTRTTLSS